MVFLFFPGFFHISSSFPMVQPSTPGVYPRLDVAVSPCALLQKLQLSRSAWGFGDLTEKDLVTYQDLERRGEGSAGVFQRFSTGRMDELFSDFFHGDFSTEILG